MAKPKTVKVGDRYMHVFCGDARSTVGGAPVIVANRYYLLGKSNMLKSLVISPYIEARRCTPCRALLAIRWRKMIGVLARVNASVVKLLGSLNSNLTFFSCVNVE